MKTKYMVAALLSAAATGALLNGPLPFVGSADAQSQRGSGSANAPAKNADTYQQLNLFGEVFERVRSDYVEQTNDKDLIENALNGMLTALDPHSSYLNEKSYRDMQVQTRGEFGGLGIEVTQENGLVKVVSPIDDTPAARAGLQPNDLIVALDGEQVQGLTLQEAVEKMRGPVNSSIKITIRRGTREPFDVTLQRAVITVQSVRSRMEGEDIGYVRITSFSEQTNSGLTKAVEKLQQDSKGKMRALVLDLRNNPGGLLDQAVAVSDSFLEKGEIVSTRTRRADDAQRFNARPGDLIKGLPLVVLINSGSASASEIVAGALQDQRRAIIMGTKSFGKGSVQTIIPLPGHGAMRLTTARYYTPSGRSIQALGIEPDIQVEQLRLEAISENGRQREADLRGALRNPNAAPGVPVTPTPNGNGENAAAVAAEVQDYQLTRALDVLRGIALYNSKPQ
ncbi:MAG TPA: S41 family peptidase [Alphaproteobacteria bacterium]|nr:S41 family peptidase [Alphaproteobacteria bacterium]